MLSRIDVIKGLPYTCLMIHNSSLINLVYITLNPLHLSHNSLQVLADVHRWEGAREGQEEGVGGCCVVDETGAHTPACFPGCSGINCGKLNSQTVQLKHECL